MAWTDERIEQLKTLWGQGMTASQIAEALGGVSRNAVIGKAHRLGLEARPSPVRANEVPTVAPVETRSDGPVEAPPFVTAPDPTPEPPTIEARAEAPRPAPRPAAPAPAPAPAAAAEPAASATAPAAPPQPVMRSVGPGGFVRQSPGEQQPPSQPAPPRRMVPARPSADMAGKTSLLELNDKICKWPLGHPGEPDFHFCGQQVNPGFPYCVEHCGLAYQAQLPRRDRRPPPPLPFGGPRVR
ncbi:GcrA family cell cycle regulator [Sphingomonas quercus]|uniref:GcrA family cell cycle regulator n=1 Tax=Sphingomonas quercus TaxID=2842451 RepID=A0ABS6BGB7_9SPHN|nr:GcrA family cell cycle regulator [Sphingomonas quercus]MBU3076521.1 GcrA family cell cycle regulator [Sphingomonas quercus]